MVSNREPVVHERVEGGVTVLRPASGLVTAIEPIVRAVGGTWIAHGSGSADRVAADERGRVLLPPNDPKYTLQRVWLTRGEEDGYYYGLANTALWPLCHHVYVRPHFSRRDWETYRTVNRKFRDAVLEEAGEDPAIVFIQDYHLALLPRFIKEARPDIRVIQFWHIPWPNRETFRIFPYAEELLDGLLGNDLLAFHIKYYCRNFLGTVDRGIESRVDYEHFRAFRGGHPTYVRAFPISVDHAQIGRDAESPSVTQRIDGFRKELGENNGARLFVGADRIDYTKGIPERLRAFDVMLSCHPELRTKVTLVQLSAPSRTHIEAYRILNDNLDDLVDEINWRHQTDTWMPIRFLRAHHDYHAVLAAYRMAHVAVVTSLHDGMNLVAKEFVSSRTDGDGILILSKYTGAARELADALLVNPYDIDQMADAMYSAYLMPEAARRQRMEKMRAQVTKNNVYRWGARIFEETERTLSREVA
ncbi:MAG: trehalose-6-phosphate synthase [Deltaproteobacteria bacterium]|nr:trehalose-6-phosphate synthase [Deltaproteobacteria bacterium]